MKTWVLLGSTVHFPCLLGGTSSPTHVPSAPSASLHDSNHHPHLIDWENRLRQRALGEVSGRPTRSPFPHHTARNTHSLPTVACDRSLTRILWYESEPLRRPICENRHHHHQINCGFPAPTQLRGTPHQVGSRTHTPRYTSVSKMTPTFSLSRGLTPTHPQPQPSFHRSPEERKLQLFPFLLE